MAGSAQFGPQTETVMIEEFDRQIETLLRKGYPTLAGIDERKFLRAIEPLKAKLNTLPTAAASPSERCIPLVVVVKRDWVAAEAAMQQVEVKDATGIVSMTPVEPTSFEPIEGLYIPAGPAYLLLGVNTGRDTLNVTPAEALKLFRDQNRSPLTIDEGIALVTHFPEVLTDKQRFNSFSMLGSRRNDQRVPALWISYGQPRLGWCWERNPHTWLGSASCASREG